MGRPEVTRLTPQEEARFMSWVRSTGITDLDDPRSFYDYRGYWKDVASKGDDQRKNYDDGPHFPDTYKQHGHPTFSVESKYSTGPNDGGRWDGETYVPQASGATAQTLPQMVRRKYPGVYDDLSDFELDQKVRAKYPGVYDDLPTPAAKPDPRAPSMGPAVRGTALPADTQFSGFGTVMRPHELGPVEKALHTPLGRPTGVDAIDEQITPANLILLGTQVLPKAGRYALSKIHGLLQQTPEIASDVLGLLSPRSAHALRVAQRVSEAAAKGQGITAADEALLMKQGLSREAIAKLRAQMAAKSATSPAATPAAAPARPVPAAPPATSAAPAPAAPAPTPAPATPAAPGAVPILKGDTLQVPVAQRTAGQMSGAWLANDVALAARRLKATLKPADLDRAVQLVKESGQSPLEVVQSLQQGATPPALATAMPKPKLSGSEVATFQQLVAQGKTPQQAFELIAATRKLGAGLPTDAAVEAAVKARNATGRWPQ